MRKGLTLALVIVMLLVMVGPVWAQGGGPGPMEPPAGDQQGPGASPEVTPVGPGAPPEAASQGPVGPRVETPEPVRNQAGEPAQTGSQEQAGDSAQTRAQEQSGDLTRTRDRDQDGAGDALEDALVTRTRTRLQICDEECVPQASGLMSQFRSWMRLHVPALVQMRVLGVVPFSMSGKAVIEKGALIFDLEHGNRWAKEAMAADPAPELITKGAVIKAVYPVGSATAVIIDWDAFETLLEDCSDSGVMIFGFVNEDGDLVATRIQVRVLCSEE